MAKQLRIGMWLISSHCQSLFNYLTGVFHPHLPYLSCGLNVQTSSTDQTLPIKAIMGSKRIHAECSGEWQARATRGCRWVKCLPAWLEQENSCEKATFCSGLVSARQWPESSTAAGQIQAVSSGMAPELEMRDLLGLSCAAWKEIPADKLFFGLVVYLG